MTAPSPRLKPVLDRLSAELEPAIGRLLDLMRIPSVSTDPAHAGDVRRAADWAAATLAEIGFDAKVVPTAGHPMVLAHHAAESAKAPRVLYYGHYDVQPPDPLHLWTSPPFDPVVVEAERGRRIVGRGAVDDKGQLMTFVEALRAWKAVHGSLPVHATVMLEGEEESGSPSLEGFLEANKDALAADVCVVSDTGMWDPQTPAITTMLRGLVYIEAVLHGPSCDLHSGMYGGAVVNPNNALARILAQLHDQEGRVQIEGFYDDVEELPPAQAKQWGSLPFDEKGFLAGAGLVHSVGETGRTVLERTWSRPTCDVNGIWGGYTGAGAKTVIPAHAGAKISCRLVPSQRAKKIQAALRKFLEDRTPPDCRWEFRTFGCDDAIRVPTDSPWLRAASTALETVFGRAPYLIGTGGSIPVVGVLQRMLGLQSLLVGFGLDDDRVHSPNEKFEVVCFERGMRAHAAMLEALGKGPG